MATVTVTVPDNQAERIVAAICASRGVVPTTAEHGIQVVSDAVFEYLRDQTLLYEARVASERVLTDADDPLVNATLEQS